MADEGVREARMMAELRAELKTALLVFQQGKEQSAS